MKTFQIWMEGYAATGESSGASFMGEYPGETFMDAYLNMVKQKYPDGPPDYVRMNEPVIWGCRCYDNEAQARSYFG